MSSQRRQAYVTIISVIIFLAATVIPAYAGTASYTYDDGNRLTGINYDDGSKIEYAYDEAGNRIVKNILTVDTTPPVTTAAPVGGIYTDTQTATLTCNDNGGSGCDTIYYTTDGTTPTTSSSVYSAALTIAATTTLKFFAKDLAGNTETVKTQVYTIGALQVTLRKDAQNIIAGVKVYLFNEAGSYLGQEKTTDAAGQAAFSAAPGTYKIRADYLGYSYWSDTIQVTTTASIDLTIPHHTVNITVNSAYQGAATPLANINAYLFTPAGTYLGLNQKTGSDGKVSFSLPARDYKVRADYLGRQYFSAVFNAQDTTITIPMAEVEITAMQGSQVLVGINVYAFTTAGSYLNISGATNASGKVTFRLPAGAYKFRADYLGNQYWSTEETLAADQSKAITINTGGGTFTLTALKGASDPLTGIKCYVFSESGSYLNLSGTTDSNGQVTFNLSNGNFKFRIDYLGYQHWTEVATVPTTMSLSKTIDHQNITITVQGSLAGNIELKTGVPVYLLMPDGTYLSLSQTTNSSGQVTFNLPRQAYKVRADYESQQYWSEVFTGADKTVVIPEGTARIHVTMAGQDLAGASVYVFNAAGTYLNINGNTAADGIKEFRLSAGSYKFRADYQGSQYWATATIAQDVVNTVALSTGGGTFVLTVLKGASDPLTGIKCYVFSEAGSYLNLSGTTDSNGQVPYNLANGNYKLRADYLGYQFWTDVYTVPATLAGSLAVPHQNTTITVEGVYQGSQPLAGVKVYLFTPAGSYLSISKTTDSSGQVSFSLPNKSYKVRADYLGSQFWSGEFQFANATVSIQRGIAQITAKKAGIAVAGLKVYLFSEAGSYLGLNATTNAEGKAEFLLPDKSYKFRVDEGSTQHWSAVSAITGGQVNLIEVTWD